MVPLTKIQTFRVVSSIIQNNITKKHQFESAGRAGGRMDGLSTVRSMRNAIAAAINFISKRDTAFYKYTELLVTFFYTISTPVRFIFWSANRLSLSLSI